MADYINREAFLDAFRKRYCDNCVRRKGIKNGKEKFVYEIGDAPCRSCGVDDMANDVELFHAADVRENVRGKWIVYNPLFSDTLCCSLCELNVLPEEAEVYNYCPNCGADMRKDGAE